ncbi:MAG: anti-sigma factor [Rhodocyclaceae bacterium]|nr:MAG: anti-sigma factor [Rhodocyclaceae bacterium]
MNSPISEDDLHAYADCQLASSRLTQVEAWLAAHPERRAQVADWRSQSANLHRVYDNVLDEPVPARLLPAANARRWIDGRRVAAVVWLTLGTVIGFVLRAEIVRDPLPSMAVASLPRQAAVAHAVFVPEVRHPVEVGSDQEAHLVAWLSKRLGATLKPPRLDEVGYRLIGGRLLPGEKGEVAQFMYENLAHNRLTLYVRPDAPNTDGAAFRYALEDGIDVFYWIDGRFGYALSGSTGREDMLRLATLVYQQQTKQ